MKYKKHNCLRCNKEITCRSNFCSESCRRNYRYHNVPGVKENDKIYSKMYNNENKDKIKISQKRWLENNREYSNKKHKEWLQNNGGYNLYHNKDKVKEWIINNKDKIRKYKKKAKLNNLLVSPEKINAWRFDYKLRDIKCSKCGSENNLEFHHNDYKSHIGITLCTNCHRLLHKQLKGGNL